MEYFFDKEHIKKIHFVGIGGISMSALAKLCHNNGFIVSGSDQSQTAITDELKNIGIKVFIGHNRENIKNADLVVYTIAVGEENEEVLEAIRQNKIVVERADFLGYLCKKYKNVIAVGGTHGKTTTCGMLGSIFISAGLEPTIHMGGECKSVGGNLRIGNNDFFITEACEFKKHLLKIPHQVGVILNIEKDHPDTFLSNSDLHSTFSKFAFMSSSITVINEQYKVLIDNSEIKFLTYSNNASGQFYAKNIRQYKNGKIFFDCYKNNEFFLKLELNMYGKHNVLNALASITVADYYNVPKEAIYNGLKNFSGVARRFQFVGKINSSIVIEDYAHHPTEIKTIIDNTKEIFSKKIVAVFQPHTYTRTKSLFKNFLMCFDNADKIIVLPTYSAREKPIKNSSGKYLNKYLKITGHNSEYIKTFNSAKKALKKEQDSIILIIGAGDIEQLAKMIKCDYIKNNNT